MPIIIQLISGGIGGNIAGRIVEEVQPGSCWKHHCRDSGRCWRRPTTQHVDRCGRARRKGRSGHVVDTVERRWRRDWRGRDHGDRGVSQGTDVEIGPGLIKDAPNGRAGDTLRMPPQETDIALTRSVILGAAPGVMGCAVAVSVSTEEADRRPAWAGAGCSAGLCRPAEYA